MTITHEQIAALLKSIADTTPDELDCDSCLQLMAYYVERILAHAELDATCRVVEIHLRQCDCCREEFEVILECLQQERDSSST